jgi:DNA-binding CsgD family transcriptional regulator
MMAVVDWPMVFRLRESGLPNKEIARRVGCSVGIVESAAGRFGWPKRKPGCRREIDLALLRDLWAADMTLRQIGNRFGVSEKSIRAWGKRFGLPPRFELSEEAPTPEDDTASLNGLALSPWVEERAKVVREKHYDSRRREEPCNTQSKVSKWRHGICQPRGVA